MPARNACVARCALGAALILASLPAQAAGLALAPFKDELFAYPPLTARRDGGDYTDVDYDEMRDINGRDEIPERRVKGAYVDAAPLARQSERIVETPAGPLKTMQVGRTARPSAVVLFVHGRNGDRRLGMYDRTFGGNFNRLKNLLDRAGGLYVTADAGSFSKEDQARIAALIADLRREAGAAPVVLACASMGGEFCWDLLGRKPVAEAVSGVVMLSANNAPAKVEAMRDARGGKPMPLVLAHGTRDKVFAWDKAETLYQRLHGTGAPIRFLSFESGNHGTPLRMIDWRDTLNWIFSQR